MDKAKAVLTARVQDVHKFVEVPAWCDSGRASGPGVRTAPRQVQSKPTLERLNSLVDRNNATA